MRLIDLDKAVAMCDEDDNTVIFANIKDAEVKAIPIEWLRMWFIKKASLIGVVLISEIESDWEKENDS